MCIQITSASHKTGNTTQTGIEQKECHTGIIAEEVDVSAGKAFVHDYACALQPAEAHLLTLHLLRFYSSTFAARLAQPVILQTAVTAAQAAAATTTAAAVKLDGKADEELLVELTRVAHAAQPSTLLPALTGETLYFCVG